MTKVLTNEYKDDERLPGDDFNVNEAPSQGVKVLSNTLKDDEILEQIDPRLKGISTQTYIPDSSGDLIGTASLIREVVLEADATSISIDNLPDKRNFKIVLRAFNDGVTASTDILRYNDDSAGNYFFRWSKEIAAFTDANSNTGVRLAEDTNDMQRDYLFVANISNEKTEFKTGQGLFTNLTTTSQILTRTVTYFSWNNTTNRITKISFTKGTGNYQRGTRLTISF